MRQSQEQIHHLVNGFSIRPLVRISETLQGTLPHEDQTSAIGSGSDRLELVEDVNAVSLLLQHALDALRLALDATQATQQVLAPLLFLPRYDLCHCLYPPSPGPQGSWEANRLHEN